MKEVNGAPLSVSLSWHSHISVYPRCFFGLHLLSVEGETPFKLEPSSLPHHFTPLAKHSSGLTSCEEQHPAQKKHGCTLSPAFAAGFMSPVTLGAVQRHVIKTALGLYFCITQVSLCGWFQTVNSCSNILYPNPSSGKVLGVESCTGSKR